MDAVENDTLKDWALMSRRDQEIFGCFATYCEFRDMMDEIKRLKAWVEDLQDGAYVNCVYCGHRYGPAETTPVAIADVLKAHVEQCVYHPMYALRKENERLKSQLDELKGVR